MRKIIHTADVIDHQHLCMLEPVILRTHQSVNNVAFCGLSSLLSSDDVAVAVFVVAAVTITNIPYNWMCFNCFCTLCHRNCVLCECKNVTRGMPNSSVYFTEYQSNGAIVANCPCKWYARTYAQTHQQTSTFVENMHHLKWLKCLNGVIVEWLQAIFESANHKLIILMAINILCVFFLFRVRFVCLLFILRQSVQQTDHK